jgi:hypothetical protein
VTISDPVATPFCPLVKLIDAGSVEKDSVVLPCWRSTVSDVRRLPPICRPTLHCTLVSEIHSLLSLLLQPIRTTPLCPVSPNPPPSIDKLADPDPAVF